jgi:hypothetical protein
MAHRINLSGLIGLLILIIGTNIGDFRSCIKNGAAGNKRNNLVQVFKRFDALKYGISAPDHLIKASEKFSLRRI